MDTPEIVVVSLLVVAIVIVAFLYRRGGFKAGVKGFGASLDLEGRAQPESEATRPAAPAPSATTKPAPTGNTHASGAGSVAVGGSADQAKISTKVERGR